jgi:hypothetical protein
MSPKQVRHCVDYRVNLTAISEVARSAGWRKAMEWEVSEDRNACRVKSIRKYAE